MKKLLILSDSHGNVPALTRCLDAQPDADALIFLGDGCRDLEKALDRRERRLPAYVVRGNNDIGSPYPAEGLAAFEGTLIFYTHGQLYGVDASLGALCRTTLARQADMALFGHTHRPFALEEAGAPPLYNPGSVSHPRGPEGPTYGLLLLARGEVPHFQVLPVPPAGPPRRTLL